MSELPEDIQFILSDPKRVEAYRNDLHKRTVMVDGALLEPMNDEQIRIAEAVGRAALITALDPQAESAMLLRALNELMRRANITPSEVSAIGQFEEMVRGTDE